MTSINVDKALPAVAPEPSVFLFSASWRSGSTLLQRYLTSGGELLMWGETGGALCAIGQAVAGWEQITSDSSKHFETALGGNGEAAYRDFIRANRDVQPHLWIANLSPPFNEISEEVRTFFYNLYGGRSVSMGYRRYGFKETRCGVDSAQQLAKIFPQARFLFLVRHPFDVIVSIKRRNWMGFPFDKRPLEYYAKHWLTNASAMRKISFGLTIRYEDFISDVNVQREVLSHCLVEQYPSDSFITESRIDWHVENTCNLTVAERLRLWSLLHKEMRAYGYAWK